MKFAKRMVLVPESEYNLLKTLKKEPKKEISEAKRFRKLTQDLGKKIRLKGQTKSQQEQIKAQADSRLTILDLSESLPALYQPKARLVLSELLAQGFKWKYNKELTLPSGQTITGSNIVDLLKESLVPQKKDTPKPNGWVEFVSSVAGSSVPKTLFTKKSTQRALQRFQPSVEPQWEEY